MLQTNEILNATSENLPVDDPVASPCIRAAEPLDTSGLQETVSLLRRFHLGEPLAAANTTPPDESYLPLLMNRFRKLRRFRYEYPLVLYPDDSGELIAIPFEQLLKEVLPVGEASARILRDNLSWLETYIRDRVSGQDFATPARDLLIDAGQALQGQIDLDDSNRETLQKDLDAVIDSFPRGGHLLPYGPNVALHLLQHTVRHRTQLDRKQLVRKIEKSVRGLQQLIDIENGKTGQIEIPGESSRYFDNSSMLDVLDHLKQGSMTMNPERLVRIKETLETLSNVEMDDSILHLVARTGSLSLADQSAINIIESPNPCAEALEIYEMNAKKMSNVYAAIRTAELEIADEYDPRFHDSWFDSFDVDAFSDDEKLMIPTVVAFESADRISRDCMQSFSTILGSGKAVQILVNVHPHSNPGCESDDLTGLRLELSYLGIGHRYAVINQVSAARYASLLSGYSAALTSHHACLHLIHTGFTEPQTLHPWIMAGAALESRAHPFVRFDPTATEDGVDVIFEGNPSIDSDWATNLTSYTNEQDEKVDTEMTFTFADYCLLKPEFHDHFRLVPDGCTTDDLIEVEDYLNATADSQDRMIPFIWSVDQEGIMRKLVISRRLAVTCRDRLNFWRSLQSLAGVRNIFVNEAIRKVREEEQQQAANERETLIREHEEIVQQVRSESTSDVMGRLTDVLMSLDFSATSSITPAPAPDPSTMPSESAADEAIESLEPEPIIEEEEEEISFDEPWIDSIFCTTCDDCLAINKIMFVYNDNRQAIISDPGAGSYIQLVEAAELCPARCIHPGKPLDSAEPGLDDLIKRAEPYN